MIVRIGEMISLGGNKVIQQGFPPPDP